MTSLHLVRPELRAFLTDFPMPDMDAETLAFRRQIPVPPGPETPDIGVEERHIDGADGAPAVRALLYRPVAATGPVAAILHIHGGGFVIGEPDMNDTDNRWLASALQCAILSVDYRLSPESIFPAALDDCYAALAWLHGHAAELGVDPARIAIKGESAGGGLAAGLALLARDRGKIPVHFQCLTYPMIDDRPAADLHPYVGEYVWTRRSNDFGWASYLGQRPGSADISPYAAAARADDLAGLPPTLILTGALDLFLEENLDYVRRLTRAGVAVELIVYPGAYHGFQMAGDNALNARYARDIGDALAAAQSR